MRGFVGDVICVYDFLIYMLYASVCVASINVALIVCPY